MDRKSLIASFDVLSRNFQNETDPFAVQLRTMAYAMSKMSQDELSTRLASEAPEISETVVAAKTFKCPTCGTNVLEQTKYCVKCKKKVKQAGEEVEAFLTPMQTREIGARPPRSSYEPVKKTKTYKDANPELRKMIDKMLDEAIVFEKKAEEFGEWTKEASDLVARALVADVLEIVAEEKKPEVPEAASASEAEKKSAKKEKKEEKPVVEEVPAEIPVEVPAEAPKAEKECYAAEEKKEELKEEVKEEEKPVTSTVDTDILASYQFNGIEMEASGSALDEIGEMSVEEKERLANLF